MAFGSAAGGAHPAGSPGARALGFGAPVEEGGAKYYYFGGSGVDAREIPTQLSAEVAVGGESHLWASSSAISSSPLRRVKPGRAGKAATPAPARKEGLGWQDWSERRARPASAFSGGKPALFDLKKKGKAAEATEAKYLLKPATATTAPPGFEYQRKLGSSSYENLEAISGQLLDIVERMDGRIESLCSIFDFFKGSTFLHDLHLPPSFFQLLSGIGSVVIKAILADTPTHAPFCPTPLTPHTVANWLALRRADYRDCTTWETACRNGHDRDHLLNQANERSVKQRQKQARGNKTGFLTSATKFLLRLVLNMWYSYSRRQAFARFRVLSRLPTVLSQRSVRSVFSAWRAYTQRGSTYSQRVENRRLNEGLLNAKAELATVKDSLHEAVDQRWKIQTSHDELVQENEEVLRQEQTRKVSSLFFDLTKSLEDEGGPMAAGFIAFRRPDLLHASRGGVRLDENRHKLAAAQGTPANRSGAARDREGRGGAAQSPPAQVVQEDLEGEPDFYTAWVERGVPMLKEPATPQHCLLLWASQVLDEAPVYMLPKPLRKRKIVNAMDAAEAMGVNAGTPQPPMLDSLCELSVYAVAVLLQRLFPRVVEDVLADVACAVTWQEVLSLSDDEEEKAAKARRKRKASKAASDADTAGDSAATASLSGGMGSPRARTRRAQLAEALANTSRRRVIPLEIAGLEDEAAAAGQLVVDHNPRRREAVVNAVWQCLALLGLEEDLDKEKLLVHRREDQQVKLLAKMQLHAVLLAYMPQNEQIAKSLAATVPMWEAAHPSRATHLTLKAALGVPFFPQNRNIAQEVFQKSREELEEHGVGGEDSRLLSVVLLWASGALQQSQGYRANRIVKTEEDRTTLEMITKKVMTVSRHRGGSNASAMSARGGARPAKSARAEAHLATLNAMPKRAGHSTRSILWWQGVKDWREVHPKFICTGWVGGFDQTLHKVCLLAQQVVRPYQRQGVPLNLPVFPSGFDEREEEYAYAEYLIHCLQAVQPNAPFPLTPDQLSSGLPDAVMLYLCALFLAVWNASKAASGQAEKPAKTAAKPNKKAQAEEERRQALAQLRLIPTEKEAVTMELFRGAWAYVESLPDELPKGPAVPKQLAGRLYLLLTLYSTQLKECYVAYASERLVQGAGGFDIVATRRLFAFLRAQLPDSDEHAFPHGGAAKEGREKDAKAKQNAPTTSPTADGAPDNQSFSSAAPGPPVCRFSGLLKQLVSLGELEEGFICRDPDAGHVDDVQTLAPRKDEVEDMYYASLSHTVKQDELLGRHTPQMNPVEPDRSGVSLLRRQSSRGLQHTPPEQELDVSVNGSPSLANSTSMRQVRTETGARLSPAFGGGSRLGHMNLDGSLLGSAARKTPPSSVSSELGMVGQTLDLSGMAMLLVRLARYVCHRKQQEVANRQRNEAPPTIVPEPVLTKEKRGSTSQRQGSVAGGDAPTITVSGNAPVSRRGSMAFGGARAERDGLASRAGSRHRLVSGAPRSRMASFTDSVQRSPHSIEEPCLMDDVFQTLRALLTKLPAEVAGRRPAPAPAPTGPSAGGGGTSPREQELDQQEAKPAAEQYALALTHRAGDNPARPLIPGIHPFLGALYSRPSQNAMQLVGPLLSRIYVHYSNSTNASNQLDTRVMSMAQLQEFADDVGAFPDVLCEPHALHTLLRLMKLCGALGTHVVLQELPLTTCTDGLAAAKDEEDVTLSFTLFSEVVYAAAAVQVASPWLAPDEKLHHFAVHVLLPQVKDRLPAALQPA